MTALAFAAARWGTAHVYGPAAPLCSPGLRDHAVRCLRCSTPVASGALCPRCSPRRTPEVHRERHDRPCPC